MRYGTYAAIFAFALAKPVIGFAKAPCNGMRYQQSIVPANHATKTLSFLPMGAAQHLSESIANRVGVIIPIDASIVRLPVNTDLAPTGFKNVVHGLSAGNCNIDLRYRTQGTLINQTTKSISQSIMHDQGYVAYDPQDNVVIIGRPR